MRFGHCLGAVVCLMLWVSTAWGQSFGFNPSASNPTPELAAIQKYVGDQIPILNGADRNAVVAAREALLAPIGGNSAPSVAFKEVYVNEVASRIGKAVANNDSHVKINAAIVIESITRQTGTTRFAPQIATLIGDNSPAITIWGLKAAAPIAPSLVNDPNGPAVFSNIQASITIHSDSAAVVEEAYNALTTVLKNPQAVAQLKNRKAVVAAIVDEIQTLLETRLTNDPAFPRPGPLLDERAGLRILVQNIWPELNDAQKARTGQLMIDLLNRSLMRVMAGRDPAADEATRALGEEHNELVRRAGSLLVSLSDIMKDPALGAKASEVRRLSPAYSDADYISKIAAMTETLNKTFPRPATQPAQ